MLNSKRCITFSVNGLGQTLNDAPSDMHLAHYLREVLGLTGTRIGCSIGECRACTVMVRHQQGDIPVTKQACMISLRHVDGWEVTTVEGLSNGDNLHPVQAAILKEDAPQCGYCAAGFAVAGAVACEQVASKPDQDVEKVVEAVTGHNLCRCTGFLRYRNAILNLVRQQCVTSQSSKNGALVSLRESISPERQQQLRYAPLFDDPKIELIRLLRDAAEIEHSLLVQYLYAAFSIRIPLYMSLAGWPSHRYGGRPLHLLGVAIEEMLHLDVVNNLLVALGAAPHLSRQQFPYEQDIYPFPFSLESLSLTTVARYTYIEASAVAIDPDKQQTPENQAFVQRLQEVLSKTGKTIPPNRVGSLYRKIDEVIVQLQARSPDLLDYEQWRFRIRDVMYEGEGEHFELFRSLFEATHPALPGPDVWNPNHPLHPALQLNVTSGIPLSGQPIAHEVLPALRHLSNLHYWTVCMLLHQSYQRRGRLHNAARRHMTGPLRSLAMELAQYREGVPFDVLPTGYAPGGSAEENVKLVKSFTMEIVLAEKRFEAFLPKDYSIRCALETSQELALLI